MKRKKLLQKLSDYLSLDKRHLYNRREKLKDILKQLREKERDLQRKKKQEKDEEKSRRLKKELDITRAQRIKGINALKALNDDS